MDIDHVAIAVRDIDVSLPLYIEQFGMSLLGDEELPAVGVRVAYLESGATMLQLVQPIGPCPVADFLADVGEGLHHICFAVDSIATTLQGMSDEREVRITMGGRNRRACFLAARPNGIRIELTERHPVSALVDPVGEPHT